MPISPFPYGGGSFSAFRNMMRLRNPFGQQQQQQQSPQNMPSPNQQQQPETTLDQQRSSQGWGTFQREGAPGLPGAGYYPGGNQNVKKRGMFQPATQFPGGAPGGGM